jgi:hypothetical protein
MLGKHIVSGGVSVSIPTQFIECAAVFGVWVGLRCIVPAVALDARDSAWIDISTRGIRLGGCVIVAYWTLELQYHVSAGNRVQIGVDGTRIVDRHNRGATDHRAVVHVTERLDVEQEIVSTLGRQHIWRAEKRYGVRCCLRRVANDRGRRPKTHPILEHSVSLGVGRIHFI